MFSGEWRVLLFSNHMENSLTEIYFSASLYSKYSQKQCVYVFCGLPFANAFFALAAVASSFLFISLFSRWYEFMITAWLMGTYGVLNLILYYFLVKPCDVVFTFYSRFVPFVYSLFFRQCVFGAHFTFFFSLTFFYSPSSDNDDAFTVNALSTISCALYS